MRRCKEGLYHCIPVTINSWKLLNTRLQPGDVLSLTMPASKLEKLSRIPFKEAERRREDF